MKSLTDNRQIYNPLDSSDFSETKLHFSFSMTVVSTREKSYIHSVAIQVARHKVRETFQSFITRRHRLYISPPTRSIVPGVGKSSVAYSVQFTFKLVICSPPSSPLSSAFLPPCTPDPSRTREHSWLATRSDKIGCAHTNTFHD